MLNRLSIISFTLALAACAVPVVPASAETVGEKLAADGQRITDGWRLGQFTRPEYSELQGRHAAIEGTRRQQLEAGGGRFAPGQYEALLRREEALSRTIYEYRHNGATPTAH